MNDDERNVLEMYEPQDCIDFIGKRKTSKSYSSTSVLSVMKISNVHGPIDETKSSILKSCRRQIRTVCNMTVKCTMKAALWKRRIGLKMF